MYIVYKHTSPSNHSYIGYTKHSIQFRWHQKVAELKNKKTPLAHALMKYDPSLWTHDILFETDDLQEALDSEVVYISLYGYYNLASGGNGGDTGRNCEAEKIAKQAKSLSETWKSVSEDERARRFRLSIETRRKNGTLGNNNPNYGEDHGNWSGYWYVAGIKYKTYNDAISGSGLNGSTVVDMCIKKVDTPAKRKSKLLRRGETPRQRGYYKSFN